jgi:hypothetical protein
VVPASSSRRLPVVRVLYVVEKSVIVFPC